MLASSAGTEIGSAYIAVIAIDLRMRTLSVHAVVNGTGIIVIAIYGGVRAACGDVAFINGAGIIIIAEQRRVQALRIDALVNRADVIVIAAVTQELTGSIHTDVIGACAAVTAGNGGM